jgi:hypothetical protein
MCHASYVRARAAAAAGLKHHTTASLSDSPSTPHTQRVKRPLAGLTLSLCAGPCVFAVVRPPTLVVSCRQLVHAGVFVLAVADSGPACGVIFVGTMLPGLCSHGPRPCIGVGRPGSSRCEQLGVPQNWNPGAVVAASPAGWTCRGK